MTALTGLGYIIRHGNYKGSMWFLMAFQALGEFGTVRFLMALGTFRHYGPPVVLCWVI